MKNETTGATPPLPTCIVVYTGSSCQTQLGVGGYAAILCRYRDGKLEKRRPVASGALETTNIRMEMDAARAGNAHLAHVLTNPMFFAPAEERKKSVCFRGKRACPPVPFLADRYCRGLLGCRVWQWTNGTAPEPATGEVETTPRAKRPSGIRSETTNRGKEKETRTIYVSQDPEAFLKWLKAQRDPEEMKTAA